MTRAAEFAQAKVIRDEEFAEAIVISGEEFAEIVAHRHVSPATCPSAESEHVQRAPRAGFGKLRAERRAARVGDAVADPKLTQRA